MLLQPVNLILATAERIYILINLCGLLRRIYTCFFGGWGESRRNNAKGQLSKELTDVKCFEKLVVQSCFDDSDPMGRSEYSREYMRTEVTVWVTWAPALFRPWGKMTIVVIFLT